MCSILSETSKPTLHVGGRREDRFGKGRWDDASWLSGMAALCLGASNRIGQDIDLAAKSENSFTEWRQLQPVLPRMTWLKLA